MSSFLFGRKILIIQDDDSLYLHARQLADPSRSLLFHTQNIYQTVCALARHQTQPGFVAGSFRSLCAEKFDFFRILGSSTGWQCGCRLQFGDTVPPLLYPLVGRDQLRLMQTKEELRQYTAGFLNGDPGIEAPVGSGVGPRQRTVSDDESLLSPDELQALLSA